MTTKNKKIFVVGAAINYASWIENATLVQNIEDADIVLFTGGEDVTPSLYGEKAHYSTYCNLARDKQEMQIFNSIKPSQLVIGICRGSQFTCVMNGGKLVQDVTNHAIHGTHSIYDMKTKQTYEITSTHHQMQYPYNLPKTDYTLVAIASPTLSDYYEGLSLDMDELQYLQAHETEIVLYHVDNKPKCLAIQGHPEIMRKDAPVINYLNNLINNLLK